MKRLLSTILAGLVGVAGVGCGDEVPLEETFHPVPAFERRAAVVVRPSAVVAVRVAPAELRKVCSECHELKVPRGPLDAAAAGAFLTAHQEAQSFTVSAAQRATIVTFLSRAAKKAGGTP